MSEPEKSSGRDRDGRFAPGNSGGPGGPRRRAFELRQAAEDAIEPQHIQALMRKMLRMALEGDVAAARVVLDRVCGRVTELSIATADPIAVRLTGPPEPSTERLIADLRRLRELGSDVPYLEALDGPEGAGYEQERLLPRE